LGETGAPMFNRKKKKPIIISSIIILLIVAIVSLFYFIFTDDRNWLAGNGCVYDHHGFIEMKSGDQLQVKDGPTVKCLKGKLIFN
jgi:hypothetical protein